MFKHFLLPFNIFIFATLARASSDPLIELVPMKNGVGLGFITAFESSIYNGASGIKNNFDILPLYRYEGNRVFLRSTQAGISLWKNDSASIDFLADERLEGFRSDNGSPYLKGMTSRLPTFSLGLAWHAHHSWGTTDVFALQTINQVSKGKELRLRYTYNWKIDSWILMPLAQISIRNAALNNYYYGVHLEESTATRSQYSPGSAPQFEFGFYGVYPISTAWQLLGGVGLTVLDKKIADSPIVDGQFHPKISLGLNYDFSKRRELLSEDKPSYFRVLYGASTDCNLLPAMAFACTSINTEDKTRIASIEIGRTIVRRLFGAPIDFVGYLGLQRHFEKGLQSDFWEGKAYAKVYFYGFPWRHYVRTRIGFGTGLSFAQQIPYVEQRDQTERGRDDSRWLNYLDPSIDINVGDILRNKHLQTSYWGVGVSHRSGIFGVSRYDKSINGGSNFIYTYIETTL